MLVKIPGDQAVSIDAVVGCAIRCVSGKLWLTQEGDSRDYTIAAGVTFCADRSGRAVLSAVDGPSAIIVEEIADPDCIPGKLKIDSLERLTRFARASQAEYVARALRRSAMWLARNLFRVPVLMNRSDVTRARSC